MTRLEPWRDVSARRAARCRPSPRSRPATRSRFPRTRTRRMPPARTLWAGAPRTTPQERASCSPTAPPSACPPTTPKPPPTSSARWAPLFARRRRAREVLSALERRLALERGWFESFGPIGRPRAVARQAVPARVRRIKRSAAARAHRPLAHQRGGARDAPGVAPRAGWSTWTPTALGRRCNSFPCVGGGAVSRPRCAHRVHGQRAGPNHRRRVPRGEAPGDERDEQESDAAPRLAATRFLAPRAVGHAPRAALAEAARARAAQADALRHVVQARREALRGAQETRREEASLGARRRLDRKTKTAKTERRRNVVEKKVSKKTRAKTGAKGPRRSRTRSPRYPAPRTRETRASRCWAARSPVGRSTWAGRWASTG